MGTEYFFSLSDIVSSVPAFVGQFPLDSSLLPSEVNVFDKESDNGTGMLRFIRIDCPGVGEDEMTYSGIPNGVKASGVGWVGGWCPRAQPHQC